MSHPTILQVIPASGMGGVEVETDIIAKAIVKAGWRSVIACSTPDHAVEGATYVDLPLKTKNPLQMLRNVFHIKSLILKEKIDIVHARSRGPAWSAYFACRLTGTPFVTTYHAAYKSSSRVKIWYNSVMARGVRVIAISQFINAHIAEKYKSKAWFDESKLRLIERGIDLALFDPKNVSTARRDAVRKEWGVASDQRVILLPGRLTRNKGHETLIDALALMKATNVVAILLGSDHRHEAYRQSLLERAAALGIKDQVKWMPPAADLPAAYQAADIVVCPSRVPEGFGRVVAEAQAMQKPIIVSNHGAAPEVMEEDVTGWTFSPGDVRALAQRVEHALSLSSTTLGQIGAQGRRRVEEHFTQQRMEDKTLGVYREVLGNIFKSSP